MALDTQTRPKRSPERAPTDGERLLEEQEARRGAPATTAAGTEADNEPEYEDEAPPLRPAARQAADDGLDEVGRAAVDVEKRARKLGWRPEMEWIASGKDAAKWMDADSWIEKVMANRPLAEDRFDKLAKQNDNLAAQLAETTTRVTEMGQVVLDMHKQSKTMRQREYDRARADVLAEQRQAAQDGNLEAYDLAKAKEAELAKDHQEARPEAETRPAAPAAAGARNPVIDRWIAANPWFNSDPVLRQVADNYHVELLAERPGLSMGENLAAVREEMVRLYPAKFPGEGAGEEDEPPRRPASAVHRPTGNLARRGSERQPAQRGIKDLPPGDRAVFERQQRTMGLTPAEFLANYLWEDQDQRR